MKRLIFILCMVLYCCTVKYYSCFACNSLNWFYKNILVGYLFTPTTASTGLGYMASDCYSLGEWYIEPEAMCEMKFRLKTWKDGKIAKQAEPHFRSRMWSLGYCTTSYPSPLVRLGVKYMRKYFTCTLLQNSCNYKLLIMLEVFIIALCNFSCT